VCTSAGWYFDPVELPLFDLTLQSVTFRTGLIQARPGMAQVLELISSGRLDPTAVTDRVLPWADAAAALGTVPRSSCSSVTDIDSDHEELFEALHRRGVLRASFYGS
jgi:threonine dehydrogenase-like Zn-dependent dehydrogenase